MLLLLSLALTAFASVHQRAHHSQLPTRPMESADYYGDDRGAHARSLTNKTSTHDRKMAERAAIAAEEAAARLSFAKEQLRCEEAKAQLAANTRIAQQKQAKQQRLDAQQEAAAAPEVAARIAEEQEASRLRNLRKDVTALVAKHNEAKRIAAFMERRIQAEGERLAELTNEGASNLLGDRVQAATDAARWAPRFERMEEEAEQDMLQKAYRDRRAQHKIAVAEAKARLEQIAAEQAEIAFQKKEIKRLRQKNNRALRAANKREAARLESAFGPEAEREAKRIAAEEQMLRELNQRNEQLEQEKGPLRKFIEWAGLEWMVDQPRHPAYPVDYPVYPDAFVKESLLQAY